MKEKVMKCSISDLGFFFFNIQLLEFSPFKKNNKPEPFMPLNSHNKLVISCIWKIDT